MYKVSFELTGETALLMHADDLAGSDRVQAWIKDKANKNASKAGDDRTPPWTWQTYLYTDGAHLTIPAGNLMVCLRQAGAKKILQGQKTFKELTQNGMAVEGEYLDFFCRGQQIQMASITAFQDKSFPEHMREAEKLGFQVWAKRVKNPNGNSKHVRCRAKFGGGAWLVKGTVAVTDQLLTFEVLKELFDIAGRVGLCDWRPGCKTPGNYGMFIAKLKKG